LDSLVGSSSSSSLATVEQPDDGVRCFVGPQRPKSTPFPYVPSDHGADDGDGTPPSVPNESSCPSPASPLTRHVVPSSPPPNCMPAQQQPSDGNGPQQQPTAVAADSSGSSGSGSSTFMNLPTEIQEAILDHIFGFRVSSTSTSGMEIISSSPSSPVARDCSWSTAMRHSRRRELTQLALVSATWRYLVQQRLYRHIKLKGTVDVVEDAMVHLSTHPHLRPLVRHLEIWFPVFQPKYGDSGAGGSNMRNPLPAATAAGGLALPTVTTDGLTNATYTLPRNKCSLDETLRFVEAALPEVRVLTLEGGERRKAPKVAHFRHSSSPETGSEPGSEPEPRQFVLLPSVKTLITRGQWNLARDNADLSTLLAALPNLRDWYASYSKPKSKSYIGMAEFLPLLPPRIATLKLCLESDYRRESVVPPFFLKAAERTHVCSSLATAAASGLEHLSYTGRCCHVLFDRIARLTADSRDSRLRSVDITLKNCCRPLSRYYDSGSGIHDMGFIDAFERLVLAAIRSLRVLKQVHYLRIRFVDLESALPPLNPYFLFKNNTCSGVWSGDILSEMSAARPYAQWDDLTDSFGNIVYNKEGRMVMSPQVPGKKMTSLKLTNYRLLSHRMTIH
ncbi:hypothetical protein GMORB2_3767, partial [Geosmithia morbida]